MTESNVIGRSSSTFSAPMPQWRHDQPNGRVSIRMPEGAAPGLVVYETDFTFHLVLATTGRHRCLPFVRRGDHVQLYSTPLCVAR